MLAGQTMVGAWLSWTVTVKVQVAVLPQASVAVVVTVVGTHGEGASDAGTEGWLLHHRSYQ